jgi:bifunctional enzyme CysN/CysC
LAAVTPDQREHWEGIHRNSLADQADPTPFARSVAHSLGPTVLELGCGTGSDAHFFSATRQVLAIDHAHTAVAQAATRYPDIAFLRADISADLPVRTGRFSAVYAHLSLHYFSDAVTLRIFAEVARALSPAGFFHFKCKSTHDPMYGRGTHLGPDTFSFDGHLRHFFSVGYVRSLFARSPEFRLTEAADESGPASAFVRVSAVRLHP